MNVGGLLERPNLLNVSSRKCAQETFNISLETTENKQQYGCTQRGGGEGEG